jgi:stalled ribosome rescue protein Dom34
MKILGFDRERGVAKLKVETPMDLVSLGNIVEKGDLVTAKTARIIFVMRGEEKIKSGRKFVVLTIALEKHDLNESQGMVRLSGRIAEGPDDVQKGSYHTIEVDVGKSLTLEKKQWTNEMIRRLEKSKVKIDVVSDPKEMDELNMHLAKVDSLAAYGFDQVKMAASMGAVKIAFVDEKLINEKRTEDLIDEISGKRGEVRLVSDKTLFGEKFNKTYGIAAVLRFAFS